MVYKEDVVHITPLHYHHWHLKPISPCHRDGVPEHNKSVQSVCRQEVTACFTSTSTANRLPARSCLRSPDRAPYCQPELRVTRYDSLAASSKFGRMFPKKGGPIEIILQFSPTRKP